MTPEKKEKVMKTLHGHHKLFKEHTETYSRIKLSKEESEKLIFNAAIILGKDAV